MASKIPWEDKRDPTGEDKFEAATIAVFAVILGIFFLVVALGTVVTLWKAGLVNAVVIIGVFSGLFAIGRAIYHIILEKDVL